VRLDEARYPVPEQAPQLLGAQDTVVLVGTEAVADVVDQPGQLQLGVVGPGPGELECALQAVVELALPDGLLRRLRCHRREQLLELGERHDTASGTRPIPPS
jgi:hypothetical protein